MTDENGNTYAYYYSVNVDKPYWHWYAERYQLDTDCCSGYSQQFDTMEEARKFFDAECRECAGNYNIIAAKHGLETVEFTDVMLERWKSYEDYSEIDEVLDSYSSLPAEVEKAMEVAKMSAWDFLDYKADHFLSVSDMLGLNDYE